MRLAQLTLNNWPPLASHLCVLLLGFMLANVGAGSSNKSSWRPRPGWALTKLAARLVAVEVGGQQQVSVALVRKNPEMTSGCRALDAPMVLLDVGPDANVAVPISHATALGRLLRQQPKSGGAIWVLVEHKAALQLPLCGKGGEVLYGAQKTI